MKCRCMSRTFPRELRFRGYEAYVVQELIIQNDNTRYLRARYDLPGGGSVLAPFLRASCRSRAGTLVRI